MRNPYYRNVDPDGKLLPYIDRDEINDLMYFGLGTPRAITAIRSEPTFIPANADMYIKYDPTESNRLLDELCFNKKIAEGIEPRVGSHISQAMELYDQAITSSTMDVVYENIRQILTRGGAE